MTYEPVGVERTLAACGIPLYTPFLRVDPHASATVLLY